MPCCKWLYHPLSWVVATSTIGIATIIRGRPTCQQPGAPGSSGPLFSLESWPPKAGSRVIFRMLWFSIQKLQRRGAPSQPSRKVLQDLALENPGRCFVVAQGGEVKPHLQLRFLCSRGERWNHLGIFDGNFVPLVFSRREKKKKESCNLLFQLPGKDAGD